MTRWLAAAALIALTLFAWDVPDCPFCTHAAHYSAHSPDLDFSFIEPEQPFEVALAQVPIGCELETPVVVAASWVPLVRAPKHGPPA
jgi:hypothetical protein